MGTINLIFVVLALASFSSAFPNYDLEGDAGFSVAVAGEKEVLTTTPAPIPHPLEKPKGSSGAGKRKNVMNRDKNPVNLERDTLFDGTYKPWGAAALSHGQNHSPIKVDDFLFTPNSEIHSYDQRAHQ